MHLQTIKRSKATQYFFIFFIFGRPFLGFQSYNLVYDSFLSVYIDN